MAQDGLRGVWERSVPSIAKVAGSRNRKERGVILRFPWKARYQGRGALKVAHTSPTASGL
jgi:hypothetical protein